MDKLEMKKIKKLLLSFIIALGTILGVIALMESTNSSLLKKILGGLLIAVVALFGIIGLNESGPVSEDTAVVEVGSGISVVTVTGVIDGDTIEVDDGVVVRLIGIDAPEQGECYYREAKEMMKELVLEKEIRLEKDISGTDNLDRLLRYVVLPSGNQLADDTFVNNYMVRYGYARLMTMAPDHKYLSLLTASREQAISNKEGMWTDCLDEMHNTELGEMGDQPLNPNCLIKGNISLKAYGKTYFTPDCYNYNQVKIKFDEGEKYFCTEQEALEAGFRKSDTCP